MRRSDLAEAQQILANELAKYRSKTRQDLTRLLREQDAFAITGESGTIYQVEFLAVWDNREDGDLRVIGSIDGGGISAFTPLTDNFIISPDGRFIGDVAGTVASGPRARLRRVGVVVGVIFGVIFLLWALAGSIANKYHLFQTGDFSPLPWTPRGVLWNLHPALVFGMGLAILIGAFMQWSRRK